MGKSKGKHPKIKRIEVKAPETRAFLDRVKDRALVEEDYELIEGMVATLQCLSQAVEDNAASIKRLLGYLFGAPTETAKNIFPADGLQKTEPSKDSDKPKEPRKGHGRLGIDSYAGARLVKLAHPSLTAGDSCPECPKGKVYELALPSTVVKIVGGAPLQATVYELSRLRCNLCGKVFTTPAPVEVNQGKYDDSAAAMIAVLKYGCGMPFYRLEKLQERLGKPGSASTQGENLAEAMKSAKPAF